MTLWLIARASGFLLLASASLSIALGTWASTRGDAQRRVVTALVHRTAGLLMLMLLPLHLVSVVLNDVDAVSWLGAVLPFASDTKRIGVGLGTLSAWGVIAVAVSGLGRGRLTTWPDIAGWWRAVHLSAWGVIVLALTHSLLAGSDTGQPWAIATYVVCVAAMLSALAGRWFRRPSLSTQPVRTDGHFVVGWRR